MTLIKSLLLGSAAGVVAVASAQAADLPTRKGPVAAEYVRVCSITVAGAPVVGFVLPGSDTCFKISGYITGQVVDGNLKAYNNVSYTTPGAGGFKSTQAINPAVGGPGSSAFARDSVGYTTRFNLTLDAVSNTAYGPLVAHGEYQFNHGEGLDNTGQGGSDGGLNRAYITWAGLTAGKADSFFSFTGGGYGWANFFSPDRKGFNQPDVLAYTASFGGGFAATISLESTGGPTAVGSPYIEIAGAGGSETGYLGSANQAGHRVPDIVGALSVHQSWGSAQISGVGHNVRAISAYGDGATIDKWGWAVDAGVSFNIPSFAGATIGVTGAYSKNAVWYSGIPDGMWGDTGQAVSGNGQGMAIGDAFYNGVGLGWATPTAWTVSGYSQWTINPQVTLQLEGSYGELSWSGTTASTLLSTSKSFIVGGLIHYDPVKNLDFALELFYQDTKTDQPSGYVPVVAPGFTNAWQSKSDGFVGRIEITRSF